MPTRPPSPALHPFVETLWVSAPLASESSMEPYREFALPSGGMHVVIRLSEQTIRLAETGETEARDYGFGVIGGARSRYYIRDIAGPVHSIGATLRPGAAEVLFGASAEELAERHTRLDDIWGYQAIKLRERLLAAETAERQLDLFESFLLRRIPTIRGIHPAVAQALVQMPTTTDIELLARGSGYSHRRFIELFKRAIGLTPKLYSRVQRFQSVANAIAKDRNVVLAEVALDAGYSDQSHFNREFREFSGMTPAEYKESAPESPSHVKAGPRKAGPPKG